MIDVAKTDWDCRFGLRVVATTRIPVGSHIAVPGDYSEIVPAPQWLVRYCHGEKKAESGLRLDSRDAILSISSVANVFRTDFPEIVLGGRRRSGYD